MASIWRDIFSADFITAWEQRVKAEDLWQNYAARFQFMDVFRQVRDYHQVDKTAYGKLMDRQYRLYRISDAAGRILKKWYSLKEAQQRNYRYQGTGANRKLVFSGYEEQDTSRSLLTLQRRSLRKASYLSMLRGLYGDPASLNASLFRSQYGAPHRNDHLVDLHAGTRLEALDPVHRNFEINPKYMKFDDDGALLNIDEDSAGNLYERIFANWFNSGNAIPFFLYLEKTPICCSDYHDVCEKEYMKPVPYFDLDQPSVKAPKESKVRLCPVHAGKVWFKGRFGLRAADTTGSYDGKCGPGWAAYAFSEKGELFIAKHQEFVWHHPSFLSGKPLRCAGMILIRHGKVAGVNNNSGHYHPNPGHLYRFVKFLDEAQNAIKPDAEVRCKHPEFTGTPGQFRQWYATEYLFTLPPYKGLKDPNVGKMGLRANGK
jgi:hypothetical protein